MILARRVLIALAALVLLASAPAYARPAADPLVVDLSSHVVAITSGFHGTNLLLFGAVDGEGDVVVVVIRGPSQAELIRRRDRLAGLWINRYQATITGAPSYYQLASTRPLDQIARPAMLDRHGLGIDHLTFQIRRKDEDKTDDDYRQALVRLKKSQGLYGDQSGNISLVGGRLFRTEMTFPANVPTGIYTAEVYLVKDGEIISAQTTPLIITKTGVGAEIFDISLHHSALYGACAVALAMAAGWIAAMAFRRG